VARTNLFTPAPFTSTHKTPSLLFQRGRKPSAADHCPLSLCLPACLPLPAQPVIQVGVGAVGASKRMAAGCALAAASHTEERKMCLLLSRDLGPARWGRPCACPAAASPNCSIVDVCPRHGPGGLWGWLSTRALTWLYHRACALRCVPSPHLTTCCSHPHHNTDTP
jgi:hypothetical protein